MIKTLVIAGILAFFAFGFTHMHVQDKPVHKNYLLIESSWRNNIGAMP